MSRKSFYKLLSIIEGDPIFESRGRKPQLPPKNQLATFLARYGKLTGMQTAGVLSIARGSIYNNSKRVVHALRRVRHLCLAWPTSEERMEIKEESQSWGFPGSIGAVDGTYLHLTDKPLKNPLSYRTRKKTWAVSKMVKYFRGICITNSSSGVDLAQCASSH
jgi:hypothetical protein